MGRQQNKIELRKFVHTIHRRDCPIEEIVDNQSLVESGLVDSPPLQIVISLQWSYKIDFHDDTIDPSDLRSVGMILDNMERSTA